SGRRRQSSLRPRRLSAPAAPLSCMRRRRPERQSQANGAGSSLRNMSLSHDNVMRDGTMQTRNRLNEVRSRRGVAVAQLARQVGVSRQTIYAMEAGDYVPNTTLALQLARALEVPVEELFMLEGDQPQPAKPAPVELLGPTTHAGQPVQLCRVGKHTIGVSAA